MAQLGLVTRQDGLGERPRWRVCDCITCTCQRYGGRSLPDTRCTYEKSWFDSPDKMDWVSGGNDGIVFSICRLLYKTRGARSTLSMKYQMNLQNFWSDSPDKSIPTLLLQCLQQCIGPQMRLHTRFVYTRLHIYQVRIYQMFLCVALPPDKMD